LTSTADYILKIGARIAIKFDFSINFKVLLNIETEKLLKDRIDTNSENK